RLSFVPEHRYDQKTTGVLERVVQAINAAVAVGTEDALEHALLGLHPLAAELGDLAAKNVDVGKEEARRQYRKVLDNEKPAAEAIEVALHFFWNFIVPGPLPTTGPAAPDAEHPWISMGDLVGYVNDQ